MNRARPTDAKSGISNGRESADYALWTQIRIGSISCSYYPPATTARPNTMGNSIKEAFEGKIVSETKYIHIQFSLYLLQDFAGQKTVDDIARIALVVITVSFLAPLCK